MICVASAQIRSQFEVDTSHGFHEKFHSTQNNKGFSKRSVPSWHSGTGTCPHHELGLRVCTDTTFMMPREMKHTTMHHTCRSTPMQSQLTVIS